MAVTGRYDKYAPVGGGFRAPLADDLAMADAPIGVGLDENGRVVPGSGHTGVVGLLCITRAMHAADVVDVMTDGEVTEWTGTAGTPYFAAPSDGVVDDTGGPGTVLVGYTVEATRLVVHVVPTGVLPA